MEKLQRTEGIHKSKEGYILLKDTRRSWKSKGYVRTKRSKGTNGIEGSN
jgi:hypothetical protein